MDKSSPAFPSPEVRTQDGHGIFAAETGMTLLDYFAGQALPAVIAATSARQHNPTVLPGDKHLREAIARDAYDMGKAMVAARDALSRAEGSQS